MGIDPRPAARIEDLGQPRRANTGMDAKMGFPNDRDLAVGLTLGDLAFQRFHFTSPSLLSFQPVYLSAAITQKIDLAFLVLPEGRNIVGLVDQEPVGNDSPILITQGSYPT